jgi:hypothetical protein
LSTEHTICYSQIHLVAGTKKERAFIKSNDQATIRLYEKWLDKKQQLIREYFKSSGPASGPPTAEKTAAPDLKTLQDEVAAMENQLTTQSKDYKKLLKITPPDWKEVRAKLNDGEAAVEVIRFQWRDQLYYSDTAYYAAYIITKNSQHPEVVYLPGAAADLDNKFYKKYKDNIRFRMEDKDSYNNY